MNDNLRLGDCFIDVGAHVGEYSLIAADTIGPTGSILALEPQQDLCEVISGNFRDNGLANARVIHGALGERCGHCHLATDDRTKGAVLELNSPAADVPMWDLATLLGETRSEGTTWIKLDAAGYELPCLIAAREYLELHPPCFILKAYNPREVRNRFPEIKATLPEFLDSLNYRTFRLTENFLTPWDGVVRGYGEAILCFPHGHPGPA
ncbi:MAG: FkbM family methyltransferase [Verrucomicrobiota bacterium]